MGWQVPFLMETRPGPSLWNAFGASVSEHTSKASSLLHCANVLPSCMFIHTYGGRGGEGREGKGREGKGRGEEGRGGEGREIVVSSSSGLLTPDTHTHSEAPHHVLSSRVYYSLVTTHSFIHTRILVPGIHLQLPYSPPPLPPCSPSPPPPYHS